jgi:acetyl esterase
VPPVPDAAAPAAPGLDPLVRELLDRTAAAGLPPFDEIGPVAARAQSEAIAAVRRRSLVLADVAAYEPTTLAGRPAVRATPHELGTDATVLHLHGGGFVIGSLQGYEPGIRRLARDLGATVVSLDYRLAPEHPFPAAVDDCWAALQELAAGCPRVAVAGDSAGGNLAAVTALRARDAGLPVAAQLLVYPAVSHSRHWPSYDENGEGLLLDRRAMRFFTDHYLPDPGQRSHPWASPVEADLTGVAPAVVAVADHDPLRDEGLAYVERLRAAGVPVELVVARGQVHAYEAFAPAIPSAEQAVVQAHAAMRGLLR